MKIAVRLLFFLVLLAVEGAMCFGIGLLAVTPFVLAGTNGWAPVAMAAVPAFLAGIWSPAWWVHRPPQGFEVMALVLVLLCGMGMGSSYGIAWWHKDIALQTVSTAIWYAFAAGLAIGLGLLAAGRRDLLRKLYCGPNAS